jgi:hypothetical protein
VQERASGAACVIDKFFREGLEVIGCCRGHSRGQCRSGLPVECEGIIVQSEAAFKLRDAVTSQSYIFVSATQARELLGSKLDPSSARASLDFVPLASLMVLVSNFKL